MTEKKTIIIDNYDSFSYNLKHQIESILGHHVDIVKNDTIIIEDLSPYEYIILSPGPGLPIEAGRLMQIIKHYQSAKKILGVCLGMQAIAESFGSKLYQLQQVYHGIQNNIIRIDEDSKLFKNLPLEIKVGRYHSWVVSNLQLTDQITITSIDEHDNIMSIEHKSLPIYGVQFHPESILTPLGDDIIRNFFEL